MGDIDADAIMRLSRSATRARRKVGDSVVPVDSHVIELSLSRLQHGVRNLVCHTSDFVRKVCGVRLAM